jgi:hypothetical protein
MLLSIFILLLVTFGGLALTYVYDKEARLLVRFAAGTIIGSAVFSFAAFLAACFFGFSVVTVLLALVAALAPLALFARRDFQLKFAADRNHARQMLDHVKLHRAASFAFYAALLVVMFFFFERAMFFTKDGIFTGASQNYGDLPFHLGAIFSFTEGNNFPPENPSYAFAKFTYPFMADLLAACLIKLGAGVREAMLAQNVFFGFALVVLLERFAYKLTQNKLAGKLAPVLLLFCGGLGFVIFLRDYWNYDRGFFNFLWNLKNDYTIRPEGLRWGNSLVVLFITQRSLLFGLPIALIVLTKLWELFTAETPRRGEEINGDERGVNRDKRNENDKQQKSPFLPFSLSPLLAVGLLAGTLPLVHAHSLAVLFVVCAVLFFFSLDKWREWIVFGAAVSIVAVPQLTWSLTGSATRLSEFVEPHLGWDARDENFFVFWAKNLGLFIPLLAVALFMIWNRRAAETPSEEKDEKSKIKDQKSKTKDRKPKTENQLPITSRQLLIFYIPFALCFIVPNFIKLAPWEWDNIKVMIYWFVGSIPLVAWLLARLWADGTALKIVAGACLFVLTFSGAIDVWRTASGQINYQVFSADAVRLAEQIKGKTAPNALFLNAPTFNSAVVLSGRRSLMRYTGHLGSYGIDYQERELEVKRIYEGSALADGFLKKYGIEYVIISPEETSNLPFVNERYFEKFPKIAEFGAYKLYKVK